MQATLDQIEQLKELTKADDSAVKATAPSGNGDGANGAVSFAELLDKYEYPQPTRGEIMQGTVLRISSNELVVDVGAKRDAIVPHQELSDLDQHILSDIARGDEVPVFITHTPSGEQELLVSLKRGLEEEDWQRAEQLLDSKDEIELPITGYNKGGLQVGFGRITGFVPNSRELELRRIRDRQQRTQRKREMVGNALPLQIIEIDRRRRRLVLSAIEVQQARRQEQLAQLDEGDTVTGVVASLTDFGAFVDIGSFTGLLHISKIGWERLSHPADVLQQGDELEVRIDHIDVDKGRISLNRRALLPGPWDAFVDETAEGDLIEGSVTSLTSFGAFVQVRPGLEGLLHRSEMRITADQEPADALSEGDKLLLRAISIDCERERLGLSMRRVADTEEVAWMMARQTE